ncbi:MAG: acetyl-CoA carboxylase carboxyl transferase subunit alpha [Candidatus Omnitrophota bacterium]|nr:MAG: acetyl-CoA carboxylase carboxyl transferase subunit alpha [Candidatus Omnitrophota bacterium]
MEKFYLPFEKPLERIEKEIENLKANRNKKDVNARLVQLQQEWVKKTQEIFSNLTAWEKVQLARHPNRPHTLDYIDRLLEDFIELHGDRIYGDDPAIIAGIGKFEGITVAVVGHQKGRNTKENIERKFGMAHPEGYRKALKVMKLAEKFTFPVITFIDTPGASPDIEAETRGQALWIATNLKEMSLLRAPILAIVIGEGGSGGALGIGVGDRILMQEYSIYSVISPEGCASILWKNQKAVKEAAEALKLTAKDLYELGIIDEIIPEPLGGAHRDWEKAMDIMKEYINKHLTELKTINIDQLLSLRYQKYRKIGVFIEREKE